MYKKVKLNYMPAVTKIEPVRTIPVSSSEMEKLDRSIREKCKQNHQNDHNLEDDKLYYSGISNDFSENESVIKTHTFYDILPERTEEELIEYKRLIGMPIAEDYDELIDSLITPNSNNQELSEQGPVKRLVPNKK
jgi:hypothetical protein